MSQARAPQKLDPGELDAALQALPGWTLDPAGSAIRREYVFADFVQAFGFMSEMALWSESKGHHPEWSNVYKRVAITLSTHDAGGLTPLDIAWARRADQAYAQRGNH